MVRQFALVFGVVYLLVGILGVVQTGLDADTYALLGLFEVNGLHNIVHLLIGILGIAAYVGGHALSVQYARWIGIVLVLIGVVGIFAPNLFGIMPIGGWDIVLHILTAVIALYFGYQAAATAPPPATTVE